ncbi:fructokinase [Dongia sedimenti]|uniref:Fructokinase n=1 Tax=Dongia sedimenti TaxID=3064282 RepID=A0ABU0YRD3_9PROT|nr:fructokinase [Rhodospirillaceae bacterium R-7]
MSDKIRIGIDLGGTKIEVLAIDREGRELARHRVATPRHDYEGSIKLMAGLVEQLERETGRSGTVGVAIPGSISVVTGLIKNANSVWLNGKPLDKDLSAAMGREVRCVNDANCLAVSEATDGAGAGAGVVFAAILGTGCGAGITFRGRVHNGPNGIAGEWGHNPLPWPSADEFPGPACYCGKHGCLETWISGSGLEADYERTIGTRRTGREIVALSAGGDAGAEAAVRRYESRLTRGLAHVINVLDPDVIVLGGGMSRIERLYPALNAQLKHYVFGKEFATPIRPALHGDSSGIRGAAWLWPKDPD